MGLSWFLMSLFQHQLPGVRPSAQYCVRCAVPKNAYCNIVILVTDCLGAEAPIMTSNGLDFSSCLSFSRFA